MSFSHFSTCLRLSKKGGPKFIPSTLQEVKRNNKAFFFSLDKTKELIAPTSPLLFSRTAVSRRQ